MISLDKHKITQVMKPTKRQLFLLFTSYFLTASVYAAITIVSDDRRIETFSDSGGSTTPIGSPIPSPTSVLSGSGFSSAESDFGFFISEEIYDVSFSVSGSHAYSISGTLSGSSGDFGSAFISASLINLDTSTTLESASVFDGFQFFSFDGLITMGNYRLLISPNLVPGGFGTEASWSFDASFTPVPIPAAVWLFISGLAGLYGIKRTVN